MNKLDAYCYRCIIELEASARGVSPLIKLWDLLTALNARSEDGYSFPDVSEKDWKPLMKEVEKRKFVIKQIDLLSDFPNPVTFSVKYAKGNHIKAVFMNLPLELVWKIGLLVNRSNFNPAIPSIKYSLKSRQLSFYTLHEEFYELFVVLHESGYATAKVEGGNMMVIPVNIAYNGRHHALKPRLQIVHKDGKKLARLDFTLGSLIKLTEFPPPVLTTPITIDAKGETVGTIIGNEQWLDNLSPSLSDIHSLILKGVGVWMESRNIEVPEFLIRLIEVPVVLKSRFSTS